MEIRWNFWKFQIVEEVETYYRLILIREFNKLYGQEMNFKLSLVKLERKKGKLIYVSIRLVKFSTKQAF